MQDLPESSLSPSSPPLWLSEAETQAEDGEELPACGPLERKWLLWHEFMKEQGHLEAWLQTAEQAVGRPHLSNVPYVTAKEELRRFERLLCEARSRLVQLDRLTLRTRTLTGLFHGPLQSRLRASVRGCGQRWDEVNAKLENISAQLKFFVSEWEEFEAEREELQFLLAELDIRLTKVDHLTGDSCEKLKQLQSFQQCVCTNWERVNGLLQRGEALIQRCQTNDAQHLETQLLELLQRCSLVHNNIASTHTRLLSMRLVFEDDWSFSQAPDSGCPSESLLEEEASPGRADPDPDLLPASKHHRDHHPRDEPRPPAPPPLSSATHEHLGLEWDPSVDVGRSVSPYEADSSYFSANTGVVRGDGARRRSFLGSLSDVSGEGQEADVASDSWLDQNHRLVRPVESQWARTTLSPDRLAASTPSQWEDSRPIDFDGGRVRAWLGVQSPEGRSSCSRAVQTDWAEEETSSCEETEQLLSPEHSGTSSSRSFSPRLLCFLLAAAVALLAGLVWLSLERPCHRSNRMRRGFHLMLTYVNGPPPT